jgi:two-component system sensor histidine kinase RegB
MVQLSVLLFLTGGLNNPFAILILAPVTVSATTLSYRSTLGLAALAITCINMLALYHLPLPVERRRLRARTQFRLGLHHLARPRGHLHHLYVFRVAQETRRLSDALACGAGGARPRAESLVIGRAGRRGGA